MKSLMCSPSMHPEPEKRNRPQFWSIRQMFWSLHGKRQKTGEGYTLRLYESTGKDTAAVVELPFAGVTCPVSLKGFEIKTLHYDEQTKQLAEADLLD